MFMLSSIFVIGCGLFEMKANLCRFFFTAVGDPIYQERRVEIPLTDLTLSHFCAYPSQDLYFSANVVVLMYSTI